MNPKKKKKDDKDKPRRIRLEHGGQVNAKINAPFGNTKLGICATGASGIRASLCEGHRQREFVSHPDRATVLAPGSAPFGK